MRKLPYCDFPNALEKKMHGIQPLPSFLLRGNIDAAYAYRSLKYKAISTEEFDTTRILQLARVLACSFALNEPMARHIQPPGNIPFYVYGKKHKDDFGADYFGDWTKENIMYWIIRLFVLTEPGSPLDEIQVNKQLHNHSLAILNNESEIIGGALNLPFLMSDFENEFRNNDPFIQAVYTWFQPIHHLLLAQESKALQTLSNQYPDFKSSLEFGKVGILFMVARSPSLPTEDTFELVAASVERFKELDYNYVVTAAANQWTGAAFELLGGVRVHFAPYRAERQLIESLEDLPHGASSKDGFISDKDSGCMFYIIRIN
jgi:hypothetical protein